MPNSCTWIPWVAGCVLSGAVNAATVSVSNGVYAASFVRDCRSSPELTLPDKCVEGDGTSFSNTIVEVREAPYPGAIQAGVLTTSLLARTSGIDVTGSTVEAPSSAFTTPVAKLGVFTSANYARASTGVASLQSYAWDGSGNPARSLDLTATFSGSNLVDVLSNNFNPEAAFGGRILVFSLETPTFEVADALPAEEGVCSMNGSLPDCLSSRADYRVEASDSFSTSFPTASVDITLDQDRYYFVWVQLTGIARFGASVDARNTVITQWSDTTGLTAAAGEIVPISVVTDWLASLVLKVAGVGPREALLRTAKYAQDQYAVPDVPATCEAMYLFAAEVRLLERVSRLFRRPATWKISTAQADQLLNDARAITTTIGCK